MILTTAQCAHTPITNRFPSRIANFKMKTSTKPNPSLVFSIVIYLILKGHKKTVNRESKLYTNTDFIYILLKKLTNTI